MQQIADWLNALGLGQYAQRFAENDIDPSVLRDLTDHDLEKIGVSLGHRRKILRAIAELDEAGPRPAPAPLAMAPVSSTPPQKPKSVRSRRAALPAFQEGFWMKLMVPLLSRIAHCT